MPSTLLPNGIVVTVNDNPTVGETEQIFATATQPVPTADQEKTVILFSCQLNNASETDAGTATFRCYRCAEPGGEGDTELGVQLAGEYVTVVDFVDDGQIPQTQGILVFWVDSGAQSSSYAVTLQIADTNLDLSPVQSITLLSVGS